LIYRSKYFNVLEVWFDDEAMSENMPLDKVVFKQIKKGPGHAEKFTTLLTDLTQNEEEIFNRFAKNTRQQIRKSEREDGLVTEFYDAKRLEQSHVDAFLDAFNRFASERDRPELTKRDVYRYFEAGRLAISMTRKDDEVLVWRSYLVTDKRVRGLQSFSFFESSDSDRKNLIGRANRLQVWENIKRFKAAGKQIYDYGGWYAGSTDAKLLNVNRFKEGFGGYKEEGYNFHRCLTFKCHLLHLLEKLMRKAR